MKNVCLNFLNFKINISKINIENISKINIEYNY